MHNELYNINGVYELIRKYYVFNFPHKVEFQAVNAINHFVKSYNAEAVIKKDGDVYVFINTKPYQRSSDPFANSLGIHTEQLERYLSDDSGIRKLFQDVNALHLWLVDNNFIKNNLATEKLLATKAIQA